MARGSICFQKARYLQRFLSRRHKSNINRAFPGREVNDDRPLFLTIYGRMLEIGGSLTKRGGMLLVLFWALQMFGRH